jgi:hypothetical protein
MWDAEGENIIEHLAGVEDLQFAKATYLAACKRERAAVLGEGRHSDNPKTSSPALRAGADAGAKSIRYSRSAAPVP